MCCGKAFWKGVFVFAITFATGILIANLYALRSATIQSCPLVMKELAPEVKNCVPVDYALKYERLSADGKSDPDKTKKQLKEKKFDGNAPES